MQMALDPLHGYSNEAERGNWDTYGGFELKKTLVFWFN